MLNRDHLNRRSCCYAIFALAWLAISSSPAAQESDGPRLSPTQETDIGIFYDPDAPEERNLWREGDPGERLLLRGRVLNTDGMPLPDAQVELWHADGNGEVHPNRY